MDNYNNYREQYELRLKEIGKLLFEDGAFFSTMTKEEKDLFGEALSLFFKKTVDEQEQDQDQNEGQTYEENDNNDNDKFSQVIDALRGFNININITPSENYDHVHSHNTGGCGSNNCGCKNGSESYDPINDGSYIPSPGDEIMYGNDMPLVPKEDKDEPKA